jgi:putative folate metabolism gamma-glutamate ligase
MVVTPIKTHKITVEDSDILNVLDTYITHLDERSVVAVTSKIVAICEGAVVKIGDIDKNEIVAKEADLYLPAQESKYGFSISIKNNIFIASAGVDESNGNGYYILWPKDPQASANRIREHLANKFDLKNIGVIITDSKTTPLRWGVTGVAIAHSGFAALNDLIDTPDIFGRPMHVTKVNVMDGLAGAAVFVMGESEEQTPVAVASDIPNVEFQDRNPTKEELDLLTIPLAEDIYAPILKDVKWQRGK